MSRARPGSAVKLLRSCLPGYSVRWRLFCFPYAGSGVGPFRPWAALLPPAAELFGIQLPGREERWGEPPHSAMAPLVEEVAAEVLRWGDLPFAFFGHSFGALAAYEVASCIEQAAGVSPACVFASAAPAPETPRRGPVLHRLDDERFLFEVQRLGGFAPEVLKHVELLSVLLPALRADVALYETYEHTRRPRLFAPVLALGGYSDVRVSSGDLLEWHASTMQFLGVRMFTGGHFYLSAAQAPLVQTIATVTGTLTRSAYPMSARTAGRI